jgi:hypothetical protein
MRFFMTKYKLTDPGRFVRHLASALSYSFKAVEEDSEVLTYQLILPHPGDDYHIGGERGCFEGGASLARIKALRDQFDQTKFIVDIHENDPEVFKLARRLFMEQYYNGISVGFIKGRHVPTGGMLLRGRGFAA